jgi:hypothetical protein
MFAGLPDAVDVAGLTRTTTGTLITVPAGRAFTGDLVLSASVSVAGTSNPTVSTSGTGAAPVSGTVLSRLNLNGLALTTVADSVAHEVFVVATTNDITIEFTAGATGTSSASLHGYFI